MQSRPDRRFHPTRKRTLQLFPHHAVEVARDWHISYWVHAGLEHVHQFHAALAALLA